MACPYCGGSAQRVIAPGYFECESIRSTMESVMRPAGPNGEMVPITQPSSVRCGHRYHEATGVVAVERCRCGTFAVGTCAECGRDVCGDHSRAGARRRCLDCIRHAESIATARREASEAATKRTQEASKQATAERFLRIEDPTERLIRLVQSVTTLNSDTISLESGRSSRFGTPVLYHELRDGQMYLWDLVIPQYERPTNGGPSSYGSSSSHGWDTATIARWFAAAATSAALEPTDTFRRPVAGKKLSRRMRQTWPLDEYYVEGPPVPAWCFEQGSLSRTSGVWLPAAVFPDGSFWLHTELPGPFPHLFRFREPGAFRIVALHQMANRLGYTPLV